MTRLRADTHILVTGGTGSFGRAFITHCQLHHPEVTRLISLSRDEVKADELGAQFRDYPQFRAYLGDVRDYQRLCQAFSGTDIVVHAAALKRVNAHTDSGELIKTNVLGTMNVVDACLACGVKQLIFISSDKAVEAMNQYGKTKASAEGFVIGANAYNPGAFRASVVRYGNVLGSRGSVLQIWREQLRLGQPLGLTDDTMTRFWMTLGDAVELVWSSIRQQVGGEIFIPTVKSASVQRLMEAATPVRDDRTDRSSFFSSVVVTGIRAGGEKLHEKLISTDEMTRTRRVSGLYVITPSGPTWTARPWDGDLVAPTETYASNDDDRSMSRVELKALIERADTDGY